MEKKIVGGGAKKVLYTLNKIRKIGLPKATKALKSKNTCKACALGMGGQSGGMVNELGEFPSVCNKSVQAQSTDIQPAIPLDIFTHRLQDLQELSGREMEQLGRLDHPLIKRRGTDYYEPIAWEEALNMASRRLQNTSPERSFFYASGRSSNEAGFLFQLIARLYGTNNVTNCSYFCHQATGVALSNTIGTGTSTVELNDLSGCDMMFVIGANPSSNHPRLLHKLRDLRARGGSVVIINPAKEPGLVKFAVPKSPTSLLKGGDEIASHYLQPKIGEDLALFKGLAKALIALEALDHSFIDRYTNGLGPFLQDVANTSWDTIENRSGVTKGDIEQVARVYARAKSVVFAWGMGMTHHIHGVENIEYISNLALMRGMMGRPFAGLLPLRGHSNVQGIGTIGVKPVLPQQIMNRMEQTLGIDLPRTPGLDTMASLTKAYEGKIDAAVIMGGNIYAATPNTDWATTALDSIGFKLFLTTTLNQGHVHGVEKGDVMILPVTARDEEWEPTTQESMFNFVRLSDGGIDRLENVRPESVILADLADRLFGKDPIDFSIFGKHQKIRKAIAEIVPGLAELADIDVAKKEFHINKRLLHRPKFNTSDGRAHFITHPLPQKADSPFILTSLRSEGQFNSIIYEEEDSYRGTKNRWSILMNREDMKKLGLSPEDKATVSSKTGTMKDVSVYPYEVPSGCVLAYYPEANVLSDTGVDPRSKTPAFKSIGVHIH